MKLERPTLALIALNFLVPAAPARAADPMFGVRAGLYTKVDDPFLGADMLFKLAPRLYFNPNVEAVLIDGGHYVTINGDAHYDLPTHSRRNYVWLGAGLAIINRGGGGASNTDLGANFFGGLGYRTGHLVPYVQAKVIAKDDSEFVIGVGLRF